MSDHMFILSSAGLKNIVQNSNCDAEREFRFVFGEHEIKMKTIFAEFISPLVSQIHQSDPTIECVEFSKKTMKNYSRYLEKMNVEIFSLFERISQGESICVNKEQSEQLQIVSILIKNKELFKYTFEYDGKVENAFIGIIYKLTQESGGNVDDKGIVKVTSSSVNYGHIAKNAVNLDDCNQYFQSERNQNSWLQYDFQNQKVHPTHYSIRTRHDGGKGNYHPKNWAIEGSNDGMKWTELDSRKNITCLDDINAVHTFDIQTSQTNNEFYQFLRIRLSGPDTYGDYFLTLSAL